MSIPRRVSDFDLDARVNRANGVGSSKADRKAAFLRLLCPLSSCDPMAHGDVEREWRTRKSRIDPKLDALGWRLRAEKPGGPFRSEEFETDAGPGRLSTQRERARPPLSKAR
jgi:hypothetical protein